MKMATATRDGLRTAIAQKLSFLSQDHGARRAATGAGMAPPPACARARVESGTDAGIGGCLDERVLGRGNVPVRRKGVHRVDVVRHPAFLRSEAVDHARDD